MDKLPNELLFKILNNIPYLLINSINYKLVNKRFNIFVSSMINYYDMKFTNNVADWKNNLKQLVKILASKNDIESIIYLLNNYNISKYLNFCSGYYNDDNLLNILKNRNIINSKQIVKGAAEGGNLELLEKYSNKLEFDDFLPVFIAAGNGKHLNVIEYLLSKFNELDNYILYGIAKSGDVEFLKKIFKYLNYYGIDYSGIANRAAKYGKLNVVKYIIEEIPVNDLKYISSTAARKGHIDIVKYLVLKGANNYKTILTCAKENGHNDIVLFIIQFCKDNNLEVSDREAGFLDILMYVFEHGNNNFNNAAIHANQNIVFGF